MVWPAARSGAATRSAPGAGAGLHPATCTAVSHHHGCAKNQAKSACREQAIVKNPPMCSCDMHHSIQELLRSPGMPHQHMHPPRATQRPTMTHSLASAACSFFGRTASMICFSSTMGYSSHILAAQETGRPLSRTVQAGQHAVLQSCGVAASSHCAGCRLAASEPPRHTDEPDRALLTSDATLNRRLNLVLGGHVLGCELLEHVPHRGSLYERLLQLHCWLLKGCRPCGKQ